jgi:redox-sensitive bicupin YhaK (pirin superfamily)
MSVREIRSVQESFMSRPTIEGAGVYLRRALGPGEAGTADPFLLLDDFHSRNPEDYVAGFPWHPHRGIETVTYMIRGVVEHGDSIGNKGAITSGDVQWMTAGNGILHQEMPQRFKGMFQGFQLWVNLPASHKMMKPRYRDVRSEQIPSHSPERGVDIKVVAGKSDGVEGPVKDLVVETEYLDVSLAAGRTFVHQVKKGNTALAYVFEGSALLSPESKSEIGAEKVVVFGEGPEIEVHTGANHARFLLISGRPLREPIAWGGPIVMNTQAELDLAFEELRNGEFIKRG